MNKKISLGVAIALMAIASAVTIVITTSFSMNNFNSRMRNLREREVMYNKLAEIDSLVRQNYLWEFEEEDLMNAVAKGYVAGLEDPYGMYMTPEEYSSTMEKYEGQKASIGISAVKDPSGYIKVVEVYPESPAETAGVQPGDLIVEVDGTMVTAENYQELISGMAGEEGSSLDIVVRRDNKDSDMEIVRRTIEVPMVLSEQYGSVGYLQIKEFNNNTPAQFDEHLNRLRGNGVQALIFDVRNNPGGTIDSVVAMLDTLLPEGELVSATYKDGRTEVLAYSDEKEVNLPMVVLTNENTASAAELFAQAIKDYNKGRTVGTQTYGKGVMQTIYPLSDGGALDITVAMYNPPKSPNFNGVGVKPDYEVQLTAEQQKNFFDLDEESDPQLKKALELANAAIKVGGFDGLSEKPAEIQPAEPEEDQNTEESSSEEEQAEDAQQDTENTEESEASQEEAEEEEAA